MNSCSYRQIQCYILPERSHNNSYITYVFDTPLAYMLFLFVILIGRGNPSISLFFFSLTCYKHLNAGGNSMSDGSQKQILFLFFFFWNFFLFFFQIVIASWWITSWKVQREREKKILLFFIFSKSSLSLSQYFIFLYKFLYEKNQTNVRLLFSCWMREEKPFKVKYTLGCTSTIGPSS